MFCNLLKKKMDHCPFASSCHAAKFPLLSVWLPRLGGEAEPLFFCQFPQRWNLSGACLALESYSGIVLWSSTHTHTRLNKQSPELKSKPDTSWSLKNSPPFACCQRFSTAYVLPPLVMEQSSSITSIANQWSFANFWIYANTSKF